jgi:hypothetical protein
MADTLVGYLERQRKGGSKAGGKLICSSRNTGLLCIHRRTC